MPAMPAAHLAEVEGHPLIVGELCLHVHRLGRGRVEECCRGLHRRNDVVHNLQWASAIRHQKHTWSADLEWDSRSSRGSTESCGQLRQG